MFKNYLKITLTLLYRHKLYSFINIAGLAVGLAACLIIGLYVRYELSYDSWHPDADRIYRVSRDYYPRDGSPEMLLATNAPQAGPLLKDDFPEIESFARIFHATGILVSREETNSYEDLLFADGNIFEFFEFDWLQGDPAQALRAPGTIVLTESMARRYFGSEDAMGKVFSLPFELSLRVTGVIRDMPGNTHLQGNGIASLDTYINRFGPGFAENWASNNFYTYVKLREGASVDAIAAGLPAFIERRVEAIENVGSGMRIQPLSDIQLHSSQLQFPLKPTGNINTVITLIAVAVCILLIACFNFMNLSTARSSQRGREVGMRKALGAGRHEIIQQFLGESLLSSLIALAVAVALVELVLPVFNASLGTNLVFDFFSDSFLLLGFFVITCMTGLIAGAYPAFYMSAFQSSRVLRGEVNRGRAGLMFRNVLVVLQFSASIVLVVATAVVYLQLNFARTKDTGFNREHVLILNNLDSRWVTLKQELSGYPGITAMSASNLAPGVNNANAFLARYEGNDTARGMQWLAVDYDFFDMYGINMLAGRDFSEAFSTDRLVYPTDESPHTSAGFILSEMAVRQFGWTPETAINKQFELGVQDGFGQSIRGPVIGVVADINFESVTTPIEPVVYFLPPDTLFSVPALQAASVRLSGDNLDQTLDFIDSAWGKVYPDRPIVRSFLDQNFQALYEKDQRLGNLFFYFSALAIVIACLGLFGLASFNAERRRKEIGVRKVMGGSVWGIVLLLTNDFSKLVLLSNVIAWPVAWYSMNLWLSNFAYRIDLTPMIFIGSGLIALCIAWVTVGGTAAKAASQKPVLALRYE